MQTASFIGVINTILIIMMIYYGLKFVGKYLAPIFLQKMMQNVAKKYNHQHGQEGFDKAREGETTIEKKPRGTKESNKEVGEYIDYEEIDD